MRIIAGKWRGHHLVSFKANHIRPTTDRVKESQFNILQNSIEASCVLDLFCGTGNLGIEALSRGAKHIVFVDNHRKSLQITSENLLKLKVPAENFTLKSENVLTFLKTYKGSAFDIIFVDPPFTEEMAHDVLLVADQSEAFGADTILTIESAQKERVDVEYQTIICVDQRKFGDKFLSFFRKKEHKEV